MARKTITGIRLATMELNMGPYGLVDRGAVDVEDDRIVWAGQEKDLPAEWRKAEAEDFDGRLATPALVDCHTHLVFGGNRAREFEMRLEGASYEEIARAGGGIVSTVSATRDLDENQ